MLLVAFRHRQENAANQDQRNEQGADVLGDGNVPLADVVRVGDTLLKMTGIVGIVTVQLHDAALVVAPAHGIAVIGGLAVMELAGHEDCRMTAVEQDDGQRDGDALVAVAADVPAVAIDDVLDDERACIEALRLFRDVRIRRNSLHIFRCCLRLRLGKCILARKDHR